MSKIIVLSCTNRLNSYTREVSNLYMNLLTSKGIDCELFSFESLPSDFIVSDTYGNRSFEFEKTINSVIHPNGKFIFVMPEYNGSFPGVLKLFLDAVPPREWTGKKACLVGVSSGRAGNLRGMEHLTGILNYLKMHVYYNKLPISQIDKVINLDGQLIQPEQLSIYESQIDGFLTF